MNEIIDTCLSSKVGTVPGAYPERARRAVLRTPAVFPAGRDAAARSPHCFSVGNARAHYSHTAPRHGERRAFIIRALPPRVAAEHERPCENPAGSGGALFRRCTISDGPSNVNAAGTLRKGGIFTTSNEGEDTNETFVFRVYVSNREAYPRIREIVESRRNPSLFLPTASNFLFVFFLLMLINGSRKNRTILQE